MTERQLKLVSPEGDKLPPASPFHNEGRTLAGWFLTWGLIITSALVGAGLIAHVMPLTIAGLVGVV
ncbi:MAG TPA: hypothetical protein DHV14_09515, partial [Micrococcales bacterium]|nr:hypothetical protein [Micrococcales bacterium]